MAKSIRTVTRADFGMAITDIKIHTFEKDAIPIGEFYAGFSDSQHNSFKKFSMKMDQVIKKERAAQLALDWLRRFLIN
jgi:nicotinamide mononucleotide (NMN) deamidase PncC